MADRVHWQGYTAKDAPEALRKRAAGARAKAIATIEIIIYDTQPGQSEVTLSVAPTGAFAAYHRGGSAQAAVSDAIYKVAIRELHNGLDVLAQS